MLLVKPRYQHLIPQFDPRTQENIFFNFFSCKRFLFLSILIERLLIVCQTYYIFTISTYILLNYCIIGMLIRILVISHSYVNNIKGYYQWPTFCCLSLAWDIGTFLSWSGSMNKKFYLYFICWNLKWKSRKNFPLTIEQKFLINQSSSLGVRVTWSPVQFQAGAKFARKGNVVGFFLVSSRDDKNFAVTVSSVETGEKKKFLT